MNCRGLHDTGFWAGNRSFYLEWKIEKHHAIAGPARRCFPSTQDPSHMQVAGATFSIVDADDHNVQKLTSGSRYESQTMQPAEDF